MLSQLPPFWSHFCFSPSPLKTLSFSRSPPNQSQKNDDLKPVHRWIVMKFQYHVRNQISSILTVGNFDIMSELRETPFALQPFSFPQKPRAVLVKLRSRFRQPLDFHEIWICFSKFDSARCHRWDLRDNIRGGEKKESHEDSTSGGFNLFSVSLTFGNSIGAVG